MTLTIDTLTNEKLAIFNNPRFKQVAIDLAKAMDIEIKEENGTLILFNAYAVLDKTGKEMGIDILSEYAN